MDKDLNQEIQYVHGVALGILGLGIWLKGDSGIGKSEISLSLIDRGHKLVADDAILLSKQQDQIKLQAPAKSYGFIHIRNIGFIDIGQIYSKTALVNNIKLDLIIELVNSLDQTQDHLLHSLFQEDIFGIKITKYQLFIGENRPLALLIEIIVKDFIQQKIGYHAHNEFINSHLKQQLE